MNKRKKSRENNTVVVIVRSIKHIHWQRISSSQISLQLRRRYDLCASSGVQSDVSKLIDRIKISINNTDLILLNEINGLCLR